ncbi:TPA: hypothetical protein ACSP1Y_004526, partial [Aeromonas hydrophila]
NGKPAALTGSEVGCGGVIIGGSSVFIGDLAPGSAETSPLTMPVAELPCVFAKSCTVPLTTIEAATGAEPLENFGRVLVLAPMPSSAS